MTADAVEQPTKTAAELIREVAKADPEAHAQALARAYGCGPQRIQLRRTKGWRKPEGSVVVARPSKWGNPFRVYRCDCCGHWDVVDENGVRYLIDHNIARNYPPRPDGRREAAAKAVELFASLYDVFGEREADEAVAELRGRDLACWCPLKDENGRRVPCHADVLLEIANA